MRTAINSVSFYPNKGQHQPSFPHYIFQMVACYCNRRPSWEINCCLWSKVFGGITAIHCVQCMVITFKWKADTMAQSNCPVTLFSRRVCLMKLFIFQSMEPTEGVSISIRHHLQRSNGGCESDWKSQTGCVSPWKCTQGLLPGTVFLYMWLNGTLPCI